MPSVWTAALRLAAVSTLQLVDAVAAPPAATVAAAEARDLVFLDQSKQISLSIPFPCNEAPSSSSELVVDLSIAPDLDLRTATLYIDNRYRLGLGCSDSSCHNSAGLFLRDNDRGSYLANLTWDGIAFDRLKEHEIEDQTQEIVFKVRKGSSMWPEPFTCPGPDPQFTVISRVDGGVRRWSAMRTYEQSQLTLPMNNVPSHSRLDSSQDPPPEYDLAGELEALRLLENQAQDLQTQINAKKHVIGNSIRQHKDSLCLKHLIQECDGIGCAARAVLQRICSKVGIRTDPMSDFSRMDNEQVVNMLSSSSSSNRFSTSSRFLRKGRVHGNRFVDEKSQAHFGLNTIAEEPAHPDTSSSAFMELAQKQFRNPFVKVFSIIAAVLGLTALVGFLRKRCMSMRRRVEHAADREERRNARAYRRAARRAIMRKLWDNFIAAFNCFGSSRSQPTPWRIEDYEEKRALILQDAFLEQDLDVAEKGEVMEAEIRELRHAQEIVSSLVHVVDDRRLPNYSNINNSNNHTHPRYQLADGSMPFPMNVIADPPPPLVALPYTPTSSSARSRAPSDGSTLPSYFSESLPDYSSRPEEFDFTNPQPSSYSSSSSSILNVGTADYFPALAADDLNNGQDHNGRSRSTSDSSGGSRDNGTSSGSVPHSDSTPPSDVSSRRDSAPGSVSGCEVESGPGLGSERFTPTSSVRDFSPRMSEETLRTRQSRDTR